MIAVLMCVTPQVQLIIVYALVKRPERPMSEGCKQQSRAGPKDLQLKVHNIR